MDPEVTTQEQSTQETQSQPQEQQSQESNDAFEAGFNAARGEDPKPASTETPKAEAATETPKVEETKAPKPEEPDPWAGVSPIVKTTLDSVTKSLSTIDNLSQRFRAVEGHVGGALKDVKEMKAALAAAKTATDSGAAAPSQAQIEAASKSGEKWKAIQEMYPEWAEATEERLAMLSRAPAEQAPVDIEPIRQSIKTELLDPVLMELRQEREDRVTERHPKWKEIAPSPEFKAWFDVQTPEVQALAKSPLATKTIRLFDLYDEHAKKVEKDKQDKQRLAGAVTPKGSAPPGVTQPSPEAEFEAGFRAVRPG